MGRAAGPPCGARCYGAGWHPVGWHGAERSDMRGAVGQGWERYGAKRRSAVSCHPGSWRTALWGRDSRPPHGSCGAAALPAGSTCRRGNRQEAGGMCLSFPPPAVRHRPDASCGAGVWGWALPQPPRDSGSPVPPIAVTCHSPRPHSGRCRRVPQWAQHPPGEPPAPRLSPRDAGAVPQGVPSLTPPAPPASPRPVPQAQVRQELLHGHLIQEDKIGFAKFGTLQLCHAAPAGYPLPPFNRAGFLHHQRSPRPRRRRREDPVSSSPPMGDSEVATGLGKPKFGPTLTLSACCLPHYHTVPKTQ